MMLFQRKAQRPAFSESIRNIRAYSWTKNLLLTGATAIGLANSGCGLSFYVEDYGTAREPADIAHAEFFDDPRAIGLNGKGMRVTRSYNLSDKLGSETFTYEGTYRVAVIIVSNAPPLVYALGRTLDQVKTEAQANIHAQKVAFLKAKIHEIISDAGYLKRTGWSYQAVTSDEDQFLDSLISALINVDRHMDNKNMDLKAVYQAILDAGKKLDNIRRNADERASAAWWRDFGELFSGGRDNFEMRALTSNEQEEMKRQNEQEAEQLSVRAARELDADGQRRFLEALKKPALCMGSGCPPNVHEARKVFEVEQRVTRFHREQKERQDRERSMQEERERKAQASSILNQTWGLGSESTARIRKALNLSPGQSAYDHPPSPGAIEEARRELGMERDKREQNRREIEQIHKEAQTGMVGGNEGYQLQRMLYGQVFGRAQVDEARRLLEKGKERRRREEEQKPSPFRPSGALQGPTRRMDSEGNVEVLDKTGQLVGKIKTERTGGRETVRLYKSDGSLIGKRETYKEGGSWVTDYYDDRGNRTGKTEVSQHGDMQTITDYNEKGDQIGRRETLVPAAVAATPAVAATSRGQAEIRATPEDESARRSQQQELQRAKQEAQEQFERTLRTTANEEQVTNEEVDKIKAVITAQLLDLEKNEEDKQRAIERYRAVSQVATRLAIKTIGKITRTGKLIDHPVTNQVVKAAVNKAWSHASNRTLMNAQEEAEFLRAQLDEIERSERQGYTPALSNSTSRSSSPAPTGGHEGPDGVHGSNRSGQVDPPNNPGPTSGPGRHTTNKDTPTTSQGRTGYLIDVTLTDPSTVSSTPARSAPVHDEGYFAQPPMDRFVHDLFTARDKNERTVMDSDMLNHAMKAQAFRDRDSEGKSKAGKGTSASKGDKGGGSGNGGSGTGGSEGNSGSAAGCDK